LFIKHVYQSVVVKLSVHGCTYSSFSIIAKIKAKIIPGLDFITKDLPSVFMLNLLTIV